MTHEPVLSATESVCPRCLVKIPAFRIMRGEEVILRKTCPEHGEFEVPVWRGEPSCLFWTSPRRPSHPRFPCTSVERGCPWDCGLCPEHRQHTCTALFEVTQRCNLRCSVCFADAREAARVSDPDLATIQRWYESLLQASGPCNVQLSGGEPTLRDDLPEIVALGRALGFPFIQINTNGLRIAQEPAYLDRLADAGLASLFLQFDGVTDDVYTSLRGRALFELKNTVVDLCSKRRVGVVLVPTVVPGVNTHQIGDIIDYALEWLPTVRGVHFQTVSYFGRYPAAPAKRDRITLPEVMREIESQTAGRLESRHFKPPGCENALCSFHGNFVLMPDGALKVWAQRHDMASSCCGPDDAKKGAEKARRFVTRFWAAPESRPATKEDGVSLGEWEAFAERVRTHSICISAMAFQDAWTLDLERLRDCCIHVMHHDGRLIPFCAYNLTDTHGRSLYRCGSTV